MGNPEPALDSPDPRVRRLAVAAAANRPDLLSHITVMLADDPEPEVRRECAETLGRVSGPAPPPLQAALRDGDATVREAAAFALGEGGDRTSVPQLMEMAGNEEDESLVREAAVAALGAIGDPAAIPILLDLIRSGPPQVRRRCVPALTVFDDDRIEAALHAAAADRNPMVREAAEMVVGRATE